MTNSSGPTTYIDCRKGTYSNYSNSADSTCSDYTTGAYSNSAGSNTAGSNTAPTGRSTLQGATFLYLVSHVNLESIWKMEVIVRRIQLFLALKTSCLMNL